MSKKGYTADNAACEGFFGRMKNEMYYGRFWKTRDELEAAIQAYIEFYNTISIKVSLGGYSIQAHPQNAQPARTRTVLKTVRTPFWALTRLK